MKLYKNICITNLKSILEKGILPISKIGNSNWLSENRAENSDEVVYLFKPTSENNSFAKTYGFVLLEIEVEAQKSEFLSNDANKELYDELICDEVKPHQIKAIYVPVVLKERVLEMIEIANYAFNQKKEFLELVRPTLTKEQIEKRELALNDALFIDAETIEKITFVEVGFLDENNQEIEKDEIETWAEKTEIRASEFNYFRAIKNNIAKTIYHL